MPYEIYCATNINNNQKKVQKIQWVSTWLNGHLFAEIQEAEESLKFFHELFVANYLWRLVYSILISHTTTSEW